jgi:hypothetical protein
LKVKVLSFGEDLGEADTEANAELTPLLISKVKNKLYELI